MKRGLNSFHHLSSILDTGLESAFHPEDCLWITVSSWTQYSQKQQEGFRRSTFLFSPWVSRKPGVPLENLPLVLASWGPAIPETFSAKLGRRNTSQPLDVSSAASLGLRDHLKVIFYFFPCVLLHLTNHTSSGVWYRLSTYLVPWISLLLYIPVLSVGSVCNSVDET